MVVRYSGPKNLPQLQLYAQGTSDYAEPLCQSLSGPVLDELVARRILAAVEPAALEASLAAVAEVERERAELSRHWQLRRERARYEAERAARQYQACEPENRLVGRELERRWEEALKSQRQVEDEFERWQRTAPGRLSADDERAIRSLAADLPAVWHAATTTPAERQRIARLLIEHVTVTVDKASERVDVELHWVGGLVEPHILSRPVKRYDLQADYPRLVERLRVWGAEGLSAAAIAERLERRGLPAAEAGRAVQLRDGAAAAVASGPGPAASPTAARGPGPRRVPPGGSGAAAGDLAGYGAALAPSRLADGASRRRGPPRDLGRCLGVAPPARTPPPATDLGHQGTPGQIEEAEAPPGALECGGPAHGEPGHPTALLEGIMAGTSSYSSRNSSRHWASTSTSSRDLSRWKAGRSWRSRRSCTWRATGCNRWRVAT